MSQNLLQSWIATSRHMTEIRLINEYCEKFPSDIPKYFNNETNKQTKLKITPPLMFQEGYQDNMIPWREKIKMNDSHVLDTAAIMLEKVRISEELFLSICEVCMI